jgi:hypothetical protein
MQDGTLHKTENGWIVRYSQQIHTKTQDNNEYRISLRDAELTTHPEHNMWLKIFGQDGMKVCYEVKTIAIGESELDVMDADVAVLKSCFPDTKEYAQD